jgi:hypothetical protein
MKHYVITIIKFASEWELCHCYIYIRILCIGGLCIVGYLKDRLAEQYKKHVMQLQDRLKKTESTDDVAFIML